MPENEQWKFPCSNKNCGATLRIKISEKNYGRSGSITCPRCGTETNTTVPDPRLKKDEEVENKTVMETEEHYVGEIPPHIKQKLQDLIEKLLGDEDNIEIFRQIHELGFRSALVLGSLPGSGGEANPNVNVESKVTPDGKIKPGTFTEKDIEECSKLFKVKLTS